jgi:D-alanine-D-alanine ligase
MKIAILHGEVAASASPDEQDALAEAAFVYAGLTQLGYKSLTVVPVSLNLDGLAQALLTLKPGLVFNLVESLAGKGSLIHLVPALLDSLRIHYTGARTEGMFLTSNKLLAKRTMSEAGLPTPAWLADGNSAEKQSGKSNWIVKSLWEHASVGLDEDSVLFNVEPARVVEEIAVRQKSLGGACFAERYIDGREFNVSLLAARRVVGRVKGMDPMAAVRKSVSSGGVIVTPPPEKNDPDVLPLAEIRFDAYPPEKVRVVGYRAKWEESSFEFAGTTRSFVFPRSDAPLLARLTELSLRCWRLFDLRGYARVDFRVDAEGRPWILEVNANPCISSDAGFIAAAAQANMSFADVLLRIINDAS